jgi:hypothetical protein
MRNVPISKQVLFFLSILIVSFAFFTLIPSLFPHPEDFSPFAYAVAFLASLEVWLLIKEKKRKWLLVPILLVCLLALLDESGYGSEVMDIPPIYSQRLHTEIRDLHNLIGIAMDISIEALEDANWNGNLFVGFLTLDAILLIGGLTFGWILRFRLPSVLKLLRKRILWLASGFWLTSGIAGAVYLLTLPPDPKNAFFLGYSLARLLSFASVFLLSSIPLVALIYRRHDSLSKEPSRWIEKNNRNLRMVCGAIVFAGLAYQLYATFIFLPDQQTWAARFTPLALWLTSIAWFAFLGLRAWSGGLREPLSKFLARFINFLRREPAYFFMGGAILLILVAQLNDQDVIPLSKLIQTPGFHIKNWGLWIEETFEMISGFLFIAGAFYFPESK